MAPAGLGDSYADLFNSSRKIALAVGALGLTVIAIVYLFWGSTDHESTETASGEDATISGASQSPDLPQGGSPVEKQEIFEEPILLRVFKKNGIVEVWQKKNGAYRHQETLNLCKKLKKLGPKARFSDGVVPEGFYHVPVDLIRWSQEKRPKALPIGFPNTYDLGLGYSGGPVYLTGGCKTKALFAMPEEDMAQLRDTVETSLTKGQKLLPIHIYPFRMRWSEIGRYKKTINYQFWINLKQTYDYFDEHNKLPFIGVCGQNYVISNSEMTLQKKSESRLDCLPLLPGSEVRHKTAKQFSWLKRALLNQGIAYWTTRRAVKDIEVKCNLKRPACRRWYALRKKMIENGQVPREFTEDY